VRGTRRLRTMRWSLDPSKWRKESSTDRSGMALDPNASEHATSTARTRPATTRPARRVHDRSSTPRRDGRARGTAPVATASTTFFRSLGGAIGPLLAGRTSFIIAHRLSTIMAADKILVIEGGRLAETGGHEDLLELNGVYRRLYDTQFRRAAADGEQGQTAIREAGKGG